MEDAVRVIVDALAVPFAPLNLRDRSSCFEVGETPARGGAQISHDTQGTADRNAAGQDNNLEARRRAQASVEPPQTVTPLDTGSD
jgi:hypothetical protein